MEQKELSKLSDEELLAEAKKVKSNNILNAFMIGFLIGIIVYSVAKNTWGFLTLIPLYFVYRLVNKPNNKKEIEALIKERKL
jgi:hypothetical protein